MSKSIDERIVRMQFDNAQFERGVSQSRSSIEKLKQSLNFDSASKGFENVSRAANGVTFDGMAQSVGAVEAKLSALNVAAMTVVSNITTSVMSAVGKINSSLMELTVKGGLNRAMNIEQAKFQLEGLSQEWKDFTWEMINGDLQYAVDGTAYSLDAAAKAASTLAATGVGINDLAREVKDTKDETGKATITIDHMAESLRAISGVASQTGASYESISQIFSTIAGNGRIMGQQLTQLSSYGLNVAADLAKVLNKSEAQVREMVSDGEISYQKFVDTMFDNYAEHAIKANDTVTGVIANIKSAFAKIGADFFTPIVKNQGALVHALESFRVKVAEIKDAVSPLMNWVSKEYAVKAIEKIGNSLSNINFSDKFDFSYLKESERAIRGLSEETGKSEEQIRKIFEDMSRTGKVTSEILDQVSAMGINAYSEIAESMNIKEEDLRERLEKGTVAYTNFVDAMFGHHAATVRNDFSILMSYVSKLSTNVSTNFSKVFGAIGDGFKEFRELSSNGEAFLFPFLDRLYPFLIQFTENLKVGEKGLKNISTISRGFAAGIEIILKLISKTFGVILDIESVGVKGGSGLLSIFAKLAEVLIKINEAITWDTISFKELFSTTAKAGTVGNTVQIIFGGIKTVLEGVGHAISALFPSLKQLGTIFGSTFSAIGSSIKEAFFAGGGGSIVRGTIFATIIYQLQRLFIQLNRFRESTFSIDLKKLFSGEGLNVQGGVITILTRGIKQLEDTLFEFQRSLKADYWLKIGGAMLLFAAALTMVSGIDSKGLLRSVTAIGALLFMMQKFESGMFSHIKKGRGLSTLIGSFGRVADMEAIGNAMIKLATSIAILASAVKTLGSMSTGQVIKGLSAVSILLYEIMHLVSKFSGPEAMSFVKGTGGLIAISIAVRLLASSVKALGVLSFGDLLKGLGSTILLLKAMTVIANGVDDLKIAATGFGMIEIAVSLRILASAVSAIAKIPLGGIVKATVTIGLFMAALTKFANANESVDIAKTALGMIGIGFAIKLLASAAKTLAQIPVGDLFKAGVAIGAMLGGLYLLNENIHETELLALSGALILLGIGVGELAISTKILSTIPLDGLINAGSALGALAVGIKIFVEGMSGKAAQLAALSGGLILLGAALAIISPQFVLIGGMSWEGILKGITAMAGIIGIVIGAANLVAFNFGAILKLAAAVAVLGAVATGLTAIIAIIATFTDIENAINLMQNMSVFVGVLSASLIALSLAGTLAGPALIGMGLLAGLVAEMVALVELVGAIGSNKKAMRNAENATKIATLIGEFFGNIISGFTEAATSNLDEVMSRLSNAVKTVSDIVDDMKSFDNSSIKSAKNVLDVCTELSAISKIDVPSEEQIASIDVAFSKIAEMMASALKSFKDNGFSDGSKTVKLFKNIETSIKKFGATIDTLSDIKWKVTFNLEGSIDTLEKNFKDVAHLMGATYKAFKDEGFVDASKATKMFNGVSKSIKAIKPAIDTLSSISWKVSFSLSGGIETLEEDFKQIAHLLGATYKAFKDEGFVDGSKATKLFDGVSGSIKAIKPAINTLSSISWEVAFSLSGGIESLEEDFKQIAHLLGATYKAFKDEGFVDGSKSTKLFTGISNSIKAIKPAINTLSSIKWKTFFDPAVSTSDIETDLKNLAHLLGESYKAFKEQGFVDGSKVTKLFGGISNAIKALQPAINTLSAIKWKTIFDPTIAIQDIEDDFKDLAHLMGEVYKAFKDEGFVDGSKMSKLFANISKASISMKDLVNNLATMATSLVTLDSIDSIDSNTEKLVSTAHLMGATYKAFTKEGFVDGSKTDMLFTNLGKSALSLKDMVNNLSTMSSSLTTIGEVGTINADKDKLVAIAKLMCAYYEAFDGYSNFSGAALMFAESAKASDALDLALASLRDGDFSIGGLPSKEELTTLMDILTAFVFCLSGIYKEFDQLGVSDTSTLAKRFSDAAATSTSVSELSTAISEINFYVPSEEAITTFMTSLRAFVDGVAAIGVEVNPQAVQAITDMFNNLRDALSQGLPTIDDQVTKIGENMINTLNSAAEKATECGKKFDFAVSGGLNEGMAMILNAVTAMGKSVTDKLNTELGFEKGKYVGNMLDFGVAVGINEGASLAITAAATMAAAAFAAACAVLMIHSPSRKGVWIGQMLDTGVANGIDKYSKLVRNSSESMAEGSLTAMEEAISRCSDIIKNDIDVNPVITPMLDLSQVSKGTGTLSQMLSSSLASNTAKMSVAAISASRVPSKSGITSDAGSGTQVVNYNTTFNQTNNSPKALSRAEIYRQTRNQIRMIKGVARG